MKDFYDTVDDLIDELVADPLLSRGTKLEMLYEWKEQVSDTQMVCILDSRQMTELVRQSRLLDNAIEKLKK